MANPQTTPVSGNWNLNICEVLWKHSYEHNSPKTTEKKENILTKLKWKRTDWMRGIASTKEINERTADTYVMEIPQWFPVGENQGNTLSFSFLIRFAF